MQVHIAKFKLIDNHILREKHTTLEVTGEEVRGRINSGLTLLLIKVQAKFFR